MTLEAPEKEGRDLGLSFQEGGVLTLLGPGADRGTRLGRRQPAGTHSPGRTGCESFSPLDGQTESQDLANLHPHTPGAPLAGQLPTHHTCSAAGPPGGCSCHSGRCSISPLSSPASPASGRRTGTTRWGKHIRPMLSLQQPVRTSPVGPSPSRAQDRRTRKGAPTTIGH